MGRGAVPDELDLDPMVERLTRVRGVCGVVLGGSRARGEHAPGSDVDLGLYYDRDLDVDALGRLARDVAGPQARVTRRGEWGRWVDGGGWLVVDGIAVDWLYRDLGRVRKSWAQAHRGVYKWNPQVGHPLGVPDFAYAAELALGQVLADPTGELTAFQDAVVYPQALRTALVKGLWEADFTLTSAAKAGARGDAAYVALCLSRALLIGAHALHGHERRWVVNEKGLIDGAGRLPCAPTSFASRVHGVLGRVGTDAQELAESVETARTIVDEVRTACTRTS